MQFPKPLHGWRVFVGEVAIIVLGVLIALGAEQLIQAYDRNQRVERGRSLLRSEIQDAATSAQGRIDFAQCANKRLDGLDALILDGPPILAQPMLVTRYYTIIKPWSRSVWGTISNSGLAEHFPESELLSYAGTYEYIALIREEMAAEQESISDLALMTKLRGRFDDATRGRLLLASTRARRLNNTIVRDSRQLIDHVATLNIRPDTTAYADDVAIFTKCPSLLTRIPGVPQ